MTALTVTVSVALVDCAGVPLSVPRTTIFTVPTKFAAGVNSRMPEALITAVPWFAGGGVTIAKVINWDDSLAGPGEKTSVGAISNGDAGSSVTLKAVLITIGASLTAVTFMVTVPVATSLMLLRIV